MKIGVQIFFLFLLPSLAAAQDQVDTLFKSGDQRKDKTEIGKFVTPQIFPKDSLPVQYFFFESKANGLNEKFLLNNKLLMTELSENYKFSKDELSSGLSEDELIAYANNKVRTLKILSDSYGGRADVNWTKIQRILGISKKAVAIILAMISLMKY
ncbi:MAG: hypothetical protein AB1775_04565 [Bacteroidota bacterium]